MRTSRTLLTHTLGVLVILVLSLAQSPAAQTSNRTLTIHMVGLGSPPISGVVSVLPIGQLCGNSGSPDGTASCTITVSAGTSIRLTSNAPTPSTPGVFSLGTGDATGCATSTCTFTINANSEVTATLDPTAPVLTMTINLAGDAGGEVNDDNNRCQNFDYDPAHLPTQFSACTTSYAPNSVVTLQAQPPVASRFAGFSNGTNNAAGVCATGFSCSFMLNADTSVTATFNALTSIAVSPLIDAININQSRLFTANGTYSDAVTQPILSGMGTWTQKRAMNVARFDMAAAVADGKIYTLGGNDGSSPVGTVEAYDPSLSSWTTKASMSPREGLGAGTIDGMIYAVGGNAPGGDNPAATLQMYNPATDAWAPKADMAAGPRRFLAAAVVNRKLYAIGGHDASGVLGRVEEYNPDSDTWTLKASMPTARRFLAVGVVNGIIYAVGGDDAGVSGSTIAGTKVEAYDPVSNTWTTKAPLPDGGRTILAVAAIDNVVYALGGQSGFLRSSVFAYDTVTDSWSNKTFIPTLETQLIPFLKFISGARGESAAVAFDGRVYLMGGYESPTPVTPTGAPAAVPFVFAFTDNLIWSTSDTIVATVKSDSQSGQATGRHAGTTTVTARTGPLTCGALCATLTVTNVVANSSPTVTIFGNPIGAPAVTINAGQSISTGGSFRDPDSGQTWTATVSYGDMSGTQSLALGPGTPPLGPTGTFSLNHTYANAGNYTATVTVRDSAGGSSSATLKVTVNGIQNPQIFLGLPGSAFTDVSSPNWGCGSFFDQNASGRPWSATVDYGDGSGVQPLALVVPPSGPCYQFAGPTPPTGVFAFNHAYSAAGSFSVSVTVTNSATPTHAFKTGSFTVNVTDNRCATVTLTVSGNVPFQTIPVTVTAGGQSFNAALNVGTNTIYFRTGEEGTYTVRFNPPAGYHVIPPQLVFTVVCGINLTLSAHVELVDTTPPVIASVTPSIGVMWPPNHKMVGVIISALATDNVDASPACTIQSVTSNEPIDGLGDGDTAPDWLITGPLTLDLRSERQGGGSGRVYTVLVSCSDHAGNTSTKPAQVFVPHDMGK